MIARRSIVLALSALMLGAVAPAPRLTLDAALSAPYVADLISSPDGTTVAFVAHEREQRNVYVAGAADTTGRRVTSFTTDDGREIDQLAFSHDGGAVAFRRGTGYNGDGAVPNPRSLVNPPELEIWVSDTHGGKAIQAGTGSSPQIAPDGSRMVWVSHRQLMSAPIVWTGTTIASVGKSEPLFQIRGSIGDERFSPDGTRIAFDNDRGEHGFVVIYDFAKKSYVYATPGFTEDSNPVWSPDGKRVAYLRLPGSRENYDPYVEYLDAPWEIWTADASTGNARRIFTASWGRGQTFYSLDDRDQLFWLRDGSILFPWERSGWRQLWAVRANGGSARRLMNGAFEVEAVTASIDNSHVIYATNEGDIDRRHIWSVGPRGSPHALTGGEADQWFPAALADNGVAFVDAGWQSPPQVVRRAVSGTRVELGPPSATAFLRVARFVKPQLVTFKSTDGWTIHGEVFAPRNDTGKHCAVVFTHGGSQRQMLPGFHYMEAYMNLYETNQYIASRGCVVLSINYRGGIMYGHDFRDAKGLGGNGGSEMLDVMGGTKYLLARHDVDTRRVGIYGLSYGGYITAMGLAHHSDIFKVGFDMAGVHNWQTIMDEDFGHPVGTPAERKVSYDSSPIAALATWRSPVFLAQGDDDRNVPFSQGEDLVLRLRAKRVEVATMVFPNETHEMTLAFRDSYAMFNGGLTFLLTHLGATP